MQFWGSRKKAKNVPTPGSKPLGSSGLGIRLYSQITTIRESASEENFQEDANEEYLSKFNRIDKKNWRQSFRLKRNRATPLCNNDRFLPVYTPDAIFYGHAKEENDNDKSNSKEHSYKYPVTFEKVICDKDNVYLIVETTAPKPLRTGHKISKVSRHDGSRTKSKV